MLTENTGLPAPWGKFKPRGRDRLLLAITRLGLSRGAVKDWIGNLYRARVSKSPVDLVRHGIKWRLHPWDNLTEGKILCGSKLHDRKELGAIRKKLQKGGAFVDVGANAGYYSLLAAAFGAGKVLALEPNPAMFSRLKFNIAINQYEDRITALQQGAGPRFGEMELYLHPQNLGASSLLAIESATESIRVPIKPLQHILGEQGFDRVEVLKIDVEGLEADILVPFFTQAEKAGWPRLLVLEHALLNPDSFDLLAWLQDKGYQVMLQTGTNTILALGT